MSPLSLGVLRLSGLVLAVPLCASRATAGLLVVGILLTGGGVGGSARAAAPELLVVVGAAGEGEYGQQFAEWAQRYQAVAAQAGLPLTVLGLDSGDAVDSGDSAATDRERLEAFLEQRSLAPQSTEDAAVVPSSDATSPLWIVLLGHGTFDGRTARFNLRGPDFSADELAGWLQKLTRPLIVIDCTAASAPFLPALSGTNRVVITATQSGDEQQFARFGGMLADSLGNAQADLDKDQQTSLLEAAIFASRLVARYYSEQGRLLTEHSLLDDNADKLGTPLSWFEGVMATAKTQNNQPLDGTLAHQWHLVVSATEQQFTAEQLAERTRLEKLLIEARRTRPDVVDVDAYYARLEPILLDLARSYQSVEKSQ